MLLGLELSFATELPETLVQVLRKFDHSIFNGFAQRGVDMNDVYFYLRSKISKIQNVTVSPDLREFKKSSSKLYLMLSTMLLMASTLVCFAKFYV